MRGEKPRAGVGSGGRERRGVFRALACGSGWWAAETDHRGTGAFSPRTKLWRRSQREGEKVREWRARHLSLVHGHIYELGEATV